MKQGTLYASRLKKAFGKCRRQIPEAEIPESDDPLRRLAIGVLGVTSGEQQAERAVNLLLSNMVDWNEVRVSSPVEVQRALGDALPDGLTAARYLIAALQAVFDRENAMSLDRLRAIGRREAKQYLDSLDGVDVFATASVLLWSLGGHAIPVDNRLLEALRGADLINPAADRAEVQAFLERHIGANQAKEFCIVMRSFTTTKRATNKKKTVTASKKTVRKKRSTKRVASQ